ncbi:SGNH hydrolase-type esterase domain [Trinorchestia longiramus]|nr:SGNH hydrolase-type esterase domain [Trinorchestia longiramus]
MASNPAIIPTPVDDLHGDGRWLSMHQHFVNQARDLEPDVVMVGDSMLANLQITELWENWFAPLHTMNLSVGGDATQHVLWRLHNGELECIQPKVIVVLVGTNNHEHSAEQVAEGIMEVCKVLREKQPHADIVLLALLPRGEKPNPLREKHDKINEILAEDSKKIDRLQMLNLGRDLLQADGTLSHRDMYDYLHLNHRGYRRVFQPLHELLTQMLHGDDSQLVNEIAEATHSTLPSPSDPASVAAE